MIMMALITSKFKEIIKTKRLSGRYMQLQSSSYYDNINVLVEKGGSFCEDTMSFIDSY